MFLGRPRPRLEQADLGVDPLLERNPGDPLLERIARDPLTERIPRDPLLEGTPFLMEKGQKNCILSKIRRKKGRIILMLQLKGQSHRMLHDI
jgi:hypothetical protein